LGVNAAIFSLLGPLPYQDADRLVRVFETSAALGRLSAPIAPVNYMEWRDASCIPARRAARVDPLAVRHE